MTARVITPRMHLALDVATILTFLVAPSVLPFDAGPRTLAYVLTLAHALLTFTVESVSTQFARVVGRVHAAIELTVGLALLLIPLVTSWSTIAHWFFGLAGVVILTVVACTDYSGRARHP
jgi:hypothetical protein